MRVSRGMPRGRFVELYNPEMLKEGEEVITFTRDEFNRTYTSLEEQINHIYKTYLCLDRQEDWKTLGYWPKIMERVHILDRNMDLIFESESWQCYLDTYLYKNTLKVAPSLKKGIRTHIVSHLEP